MWSLHMETILAVLGDDRRFAMIDAMRLLPALTLLCITSCSPPSEGFWTVTELVGGGHYEQTAVDSGEISAVGFDWVKCTRGSKEILLHHEYSPPFAPSKELNVGTRLKLARSLNELPRMSEIDPYSDHGDAVYVGDRDIILVAGR